MFAAETLHENPFNGANAIGRCFGKAEIGNSAGSETRWTSKNCSHPSETTTRLLNDAAPYHKTLLTRGIKTCQIKMGLVKANVGCLGNQMSQFPLHRCLSSCLIRLKLFKGTLRT